MVTKLRTITGMTLFVAAASTISVPVASAQEVQTAEPQAVASRSGIWDYVHRVFNSFMECEAHRAKRGFMGVCVPGDHSEWLYLGPTIPKN